MRSWPAEEYEGAVDCKIDNPKIFFLLNHLHRRHRISLLGNSSRRCQTTFQANRDQESYFVEQIASSTIKAFLSISAYRRGKRVARFFLLHTIMT
jgi:hypothetical protein